MPLMPKSSEINNRSVEHEWVCTQSRNGQIKYEWTIKNFKLLIAKNGSNIYSSVFPTNISSSRWKLEFFPNGYTEDNAGWISLYLYSFMEREHRINVEYNISIFRSKKVIEERTNEFTFIGEDADGWNRFIETSKLLATDDSDDNVTICCEINVLGTYITSSSSSNPTERTVFFESNRERWNEDLKSLYNNPKFSDFTIISGDKEFRTHKNILAARSSAFAAMFEPGKVDENVTGEVKIVNITPTVLEGLLEFIYTDDVREIKNLARQLLAAAEEYAVEGLKTLCEETLYKTLNESNAAEILVLADLYHAKWLKKYVMKYIIDHRIDVVKSETFKTIELPLPLAKELICALTLPQIDSDEDNWRC